MPAMAQQDPLPALRFSKPRAAAAGRGLSPQHANMDLKHRILAALSKLGDRDTQQIAMDELDKIVETLSPDSVSACLSCLYDTEMQQKSIVKKHCVKLFGSLASAHSDMMRPHLSKVIGSIMRWLRDSDRNLRDACVDTMGILSSRLITSSALSASSTSSSSLTLAAFSKPLLDALSDQNKSVQTGAAMCLSRVIESAREPPLGGMSQPCSRICKLMSNPNFVARPALLSVIGSLSQIGALGQGRSEMVMPCVLEALKSNDWATRKAAAETLAQMSIHSGHTLASFRQSTLNHLESYRFDKVKPVRDSVLDAIQLLKALPESGAEDIRAGSNHKGPDLNVATETEIFQNPSPTASEKSLGPGDSPKSGKKLMTDIRPSRQSKLSPDKQTGVLKKKIPTITDNKVNQNFFKNISTSCSDSLDFEVAVPCNISSPLAATSSRSPVDLNIISTERLDEQLFRKANLSSEEQLHPVRGLHRFSDGNSVLRDQNQQKFEMGNCETSNILLLQKFPDDEDNEACGLSTNSSNDTELQRDVNFNEVSTFQSLQRHLSRLELQQSNLLQFVKDFIASSQDSVFALQRRVCFLEKMVEGLTGGSHLDTAWNIKDPTANGMCGIIASNGDATTPDSGNIWCDMKSVSKLVNGRACMKQKNATNAVAMTSDDWKEFNRENSRSRLESHSFSSGLRFQQRCKSEGCDPGRLGGEEEGIEKTAIRTAWDTSTQAWIERHGEGPSARSVWQAAKDEATLAAIRVAGEEKEASDLDDFPEEKGRLGFDRSFATSYVQNEDQWSLWSSILDLILSEDMESAYKEVLRTKDAMMLLRLMSQTGPVLDQLTITTANELLHAVSQLIPQQTYSEICIGWIQQVVDMVTNDDMESIGISDDVKKELLLSLQEAISVSMLGDSSALGTGLEQLFQFLMDVWSSNN